MSVVSFNAQDNTCPSMIFQTDFLENWKISNADYASMDRRTDLGELFPKPPFSSFLDQLLCLENTNKSCRDIAPGGALSCAFYAIFYLKTYLWVTKRPTPPDAPTTTTMSPSTTSVSADIIKAIALPAPVVTPLRCSCCCCRANACRRFTKPRPDMKPTTLVSRRACPSHEFAYFGTSRLSRLFYTCGEVYSARSATLLKANSPSRHDFSKRCHRFCARRRYCNIHVAHSQRNALLQSTFSRNAAIGFATSHRRESFFVFGEFAVRAARFVWSLQWVP